MAKVAWLKLTESWGKMTRGQRVMWIILFPILFPALIVYTWLELRYYG